MFLVTLTLLLAGAETAAAVPADHAQHAVPAAPKAEKKICKRYGASESRMGSKRLCKTAAQWKKMEHGGEHVEVESTRAGRSGSAGN